MKSIRRFVLKMVVTPARVRRIIAGAVSWFLQWATASKAWDAVSLLPKWLRRLADFIECWNATDLPEDRDALIAWLVRYAVTDAGVDRLIDTIAGFEAKAIPDGVRFLSRSELVKLLKEAK